MRSIVFVCFALALLVAVAACSPKESPPAQNPAPTQLGELQVTACNSADAGKTCDSKLPEIGIVTKQQCCQSLQKCC